MSARVPRKGWPMRHVVVAPENGNGNVSELLAAMKEKNMDDVDGVFPVNGPALSPEGCHAREIRRPRGP